MKTRLLLCAGLLAASSAHASALYFYEAGTEDTALAGAGQAARAQDASTIMTNPAGMIIWSPVGYRLWMAPSTTSWITMPIKAPAM